MSVIIGDPRFTQHVQKLMTIAGLIKKSQNYYVTSTHWGEIIAELNAQYRDTLTNPENPAPWDGEGRNRPFVIGVKDPKLTVINSGTEDVSVCVLLNHHPDIVSEFGYNVERLRIA